MPLSFSVAAQQARNRPPVRRASSDSKGQLHRELSPPTSIRFLTLLLAIGNSKKLNSGDCLDPKITTRTNQTQPEIPVLKSTLFQTALLHDVTLLHVLRKSQLCPTDKSGFVQISR